MYIKDEESLPKEIGIGENKGKRAGLYTKKYQ